jgi:hypothetical protein
LILKLCKQEGGLTPWLTLSQQPFSQEERDQVEKCQKEVDPLLLFAISEDLFHDIAPSESQIWKSHSRYYRRHAKIMHLAPITLQDIAHPAAPSSDFPQPQQPPLPSADNSPEIAPFPTVDGIMNSTANLPPITLETQRHDEYFAKIIDFLAFQKLLKDRQEARRTIPIAEHFEIDNDQLVKIAHFQRKRRAQDRPITTQICAPNEWRLAIMATFYDFLNHANAERCYYTLRERLFGRTIF